MSREDGQKRDGAVDRHAIMLCLWGPRIYDNETFISSGNPPPPRTCRTTARNVFRTCRTMLQIDVKTNRPLPPLRSLTAVRRRRRRAEAVAAAAPAA